MNPRVAAVEVIDFHRLLVIFKNEEQRVFDVVPYLDLPVFQHLRDTPDFTMFELSMERLLGQTKLIYALIRFI